jgi:nicotinamidase-related amidase
MHWWEQLFSDEEREVYQAYQTALQERSRPEERRPALIVVDVTVAFCGSPGQSMSESVAEWPTSCGPNAWEAMPYIQQLLAAARTARLPVVYTTAQPHVHTYYGGVVKRKRGSNNPPVTSRPGAVAIPQEIAPQPGELVLQKPKASAFFATPLVAYLNQVGADSLLVCGTTTSGCVRATVVDGFSWGYPVYLVEEATFDRSRLSHGVNLYEMNTKYADVISTDRAVAWLQTCAQQWSAVGG